MVKGTESGDKKLLFDLVETGEQMEGYLKKGRGREILHNESGEPER